MEGSSPRDRFPRQGWIKFLYLVVVIFVLPHDIESYQITRSSVLDMQQKYSIS